MEQIPGRRFDQKGVANMPVKSGELHGLSNVAEISDPVYRTTSNLVSHSRLTPQARAASLHSHFDSNKPVIRYKSPLRYPGGKSNLAKFVQSIFVANDIVGGVYAEPYAGGASVALALLFENYAGKIHINDADPAVYAFWKSVLSGTDELCRLIRDTRPTVREWRRQRSIYLLGTRASTLELGFAAFFLNRTNRSGIIGSAGIIGGQKQDSRWKIDARYNRVELAARVERIANFKERIAVTGVDAEVFLSRGARRLPAESLIYMDPPYYVKGERRLYANYYAPSDHAGIAQVVSALHCHWLVSYDQAPEIRRLYRPFRALSYSLRYSASATTAGKEIMFFSDRLRIPQQHRPMAAALRAPRRTTGSRRAVQVTTVRRA